MFFPEITSRNGWGGPVRDIARKPLVFLRESPTMLPPGYSAQALSLALPLWGFSHLGRQTEIEKIPRPRNLFPIEAGVTSAPARSHFGDLRRLPVRSSRAFALPTCLFDDEQRAPV